MQSARKIQKTTLKSFRNALCKKMAGEKEKWKDIEKKDKMAIVQRLYLMGQNGQRCIFFPNFKCQGLR